MAGWSGCPLCCFERCTLCSYPLAHIFVQRNRDSPHLRIIENYPSQKTVSRPNCKAVFSQSLDRFLPVPMIKSVAWHQTSNQALQAGRRSSSVKTRRSPHHLVTKKKNSNMSGHVGDLSPKQQTALEQVELHCPSIELFSAASRSLCLDKHSHSLSR